MERSWLPPPVLVAGPCVLEDDALNLAIARRLAEVAARLGLRVIFKGSFDKANRSAPGAPRGPGLDDGLAALSRVKDATGLPVLTDVHEPWQVARAAEIADAIQIPAFLCRQSDLLEAAGASTRPVNVKKGQWMAPDAMAGVVERVRRAGGKDIAVTERGTFFGYGDLIVDMRNFERIRAATGAPVLFDATHAVQQPGRGPAGSSGGCRDAVPSLLAAAAAAGADGFFIETHPDPMRSPSDAATIWPLDRLEPLLERGVQAWHSVHRETEPLCSSR